MTTPNTLNNPFAATSCYMVKSYPIVSIEEYIRHIHKFCGSGYHALETVFRGEALTCDEWPLLPKAGRLEHFRFPLLVEAEADRPIDNIPFDLRVFEGWKKRAVAVANNLPVNDWECLALAQHYGLATRLLDWSKNPLVALFFACCSHYEQGQDGAVYASTGFGLTFGDESFGSIRKITAYDPKPVDRRILAQQSYFTYFPDPTKPIQPSYSRSSSIPEEYETDPTEFFIPVRYKRELLKDLEALGVNQSVLFPDLEGLSFHCNISACTLHNGYPEYVPSAPVLVDRAPKHLDYKKWLSPELQRTDVSILGNLSPDPKCRD